MLDVPFQRGQVGRQLLQDFDRDFQKVNYWRAIRSCKVGSIVYQRLGGARYSFGPQCSLIHFGHAASVTVSDGRAGNRFIGRRLRILEVMTKLIGKLIHDLKLTRQTVS